MIIRKKPSRMGRTKTVNEHSGEYIAIRYDYCLNDEVTAPTI